jgi:hypothetical protein
MTYKEFLAQCGERLIDVNIALDNEKIKEALRQRDDDALNALLDTEF